MGTRIVAEAVSTTPLFSTAFTMDPSLPCKAFFCFGIAVDIGGTLFPSFREHIMTYGSRGTDSQASTEDKKQSRTLFDYVASIQVPHTWFTHYYVVSASSSQPNHSMTVNQVFLAWLFMTFQGTRRLYESLTLTKPSQSKMWVGLWLIGMAYYIFIGLSVWIEGAAALSQHGRATGLEFGPPSLKTCIAVLLFLLASSIQHVCHEHLASLKKYTR